jgi:hypothetical protein
MSSHSFKEAMRKAALCWDDLNAGDVVRVEHPTGSGPQRFYLVTDGSRRSEFIRLVSLDDGDPVELPRRDYGHRPLRDQRARLCDMSARSWPSAADLRARFGGLKG